MGEGRRERGKERRREGGNKEGGGRGQGRRGREGRRTDGWDDWRNVLYCAMLQLKAGVCSGVS